MLPLALLALVQVQLIHAQNTALQLNTLQNFTAATLPRSPVFALPDSSSLSVSVAVCGNDASATPRFFITNDTTITQPGPDTGDPNVFEVALSDGWGNWTGDTSGGGYLSVMNAGQTPFEIGVSDQGPMHSMSPSLDVLPLFGDSTSNQALLFSPPIAPAPSFNDPRYPNYTLPVANLSYPVGPSPPPNVTLFMIPTSASSMSSLPRTGCAMRSTTADDARNFGAAQSEGLWLKDQTGWRWQWVVTGLSPQTNYTVYSVTDGTHVAGPINFVTKSAAFSCSIVHSLPYCPSVNYAVPIAPPPATVRNGVHTAQTLPDDAVAPLFQTLTNFTVSLTTFPCGRDDYSPLVSCADCQRAYRKWLCSVWFPRCSETSPQTPQVANLAQTPVSALQAVSPSAAPRSPGLGSFASGYNLLLPCIETCTATDRACPYFIGFKCPVPRFNAASTYGVGYIDSGQDGEEGGGSTGVSQDRFGNVWCNAG